jgi:hypothetical protein
MAASPQHATLAAGVVTTLTFDEDFGTVEVMNVDGADKVYFTVGDGSAVPVVGATGSHVLPAAIGAVEIQPPTGKNTVVKLISAGAPSVSVRGI